MKGTRLVVAVVAWSIVACGVAYAGNTVSRPGEFDRTRWVFTAPTRPDVPSLSDDATSVNPIDAFLLARQRAAGIEPAGRADKLTLLRRITFNLTGLPPTARDVAEFLADDSPRAYQHVVNHLLASVHYGERQGQHWLDLVRYAESEGFKADSHRENAYKYRDYIIRAFNSDMPYDRFVRQQLAGDELEPDNPDALIATGLNRLYPDENNAANLFQRRDEILTDLTDTNSLVFLGLTMGCARCHDHKFDPITQVDYYRLRAFFEPLVERAPAVVATPRRQRQHAAKQRQWENATADIRDQMNALLVKPREKSDAYAITKFRQEIQDCVYEDEYSRTPVQQQIAEMAQRQLDRAFQPHSAMKKEAKQEQFQSLEKELAKFDHLKPTPMPKAMAAMDLGSVAPPTYRLEGGNWRTPAEQVQPGFPSVLGDTEPAMSLASSQTSTGRRSALAKWLTQPDHPLTARVIANRIWQQHFGRGIVATPNDFGAMGSPPSHPKLLDWLAVELVENNWSLKHIHRLIVTSQAYQQTSLLDGSNEAVAHAMQIDPENKLFWHAKRRRLEGETVRDAMLLASGELNRQMFGPSVKPKLPKAIGPRYRWEASSEWQQRRRSVYVLAKRNMRYPMFDAFDLPDMFNSCARRAETTTAVQALVMLNGDVTEQMSQAWAEKLLDAYTGNPSGLVNAAYVGAYARLASEDEVEAAIAFLQQSDASLSQARVASFCHALFNSNEFLFVD